MSEHTDALAPEQPAEPRAGPSGDAQMVVYAAATGLAKAVPLPVLDRVLAELARGSAVRRVARRRGVRLTPEARDVLARPQPPRRPGSRRAGSLTVRLARAAVARAVAPLLIASRLEDGLSTFAAAQLLDHYLATAKRPAGAPLKAAEASRVRAAMESAEVCGVIAALRDAPGGLIGAVVAAARATTAIDHEDRSPAERVADALLDAAADAPGEIGERLRAAFDSALSGEAST